MAIISISVPDDNCRNCDFLSTCSYSNYYDDTRYKCNIFKLDISNFHKCMACKLLSAKGKIHNEKDTDLV